MLNDMADAIHGLLHLYLPCGMVHFMFSNFLASVTINILDKAHNAKGHECIGHIINIPEINFQCMFEYFRNPGLFGNYNGYIASHSSSGLMPKGSETTAHIHITEGEQQVTSSPLRSR